MKSIMSNGATPRDSSYKENTDKKIMRVPMKTPMTEARRPPNASETYPTMMNLFLDSICDKF